MTLNRVLREWHFLTASSRKISPPPLNSFFRGAENAHGLRIMPAVQAVAGRRRGLIADQFSATFDRYVDRIGKDSA
jgi:hypothetical protein